MKQKSTQMISNQLTNINCWSPDSRFLFYDIRNGKNASLFDGTRIEKLHPESGKTETLYESKNGACCGVVTCSPVENKLVFIHGPEYPDADWNYSFQHRYGVILHTNGQTEILDACNIVPPFLPGALRGGSHVHVFSGDGQWVSFTYNDHLLDLLDKNENALPHDFDQRNIGVAVPLCPVHVNRNHSRNRDGSYFSVLVSQTVNHPQPDSNEIQKAYEEAWIGVDGYIKPDGSRQKKALAFLGDVIVNKNQIVTEVFIVDLPERLENFTVSGSALLEGTQTRRPAPPHGIAQRRLTYTTDRRFPGIQGVRHWVRSSPDGSKIAFLMRDDAGIVQIWTISPNGGSPHQWTHGFHDVTSAFTWSPDGKNIAHVMDHSICISSKTETIRLTPKINETDETDLPLPYAVVFSPDGSKIAFLRHQHQSNRIFVIESQL
ncbi:MAG: DUF3748 domain-containing protein [Planctomycetaceae bacterium]|jgi:WD40 repeat protein|nr:DUF3748 domain-containing protein [Planctomycetaceae bacterium]